MEGIMDTQEEVTSRTVKKWGLIAGLLAILGNIVVSHFLDPGRGDAAGISLAILILSVRNFWYLKRHVWFWLDMAALTLVHVVLVIVIPWTDRSIPAPELWPIGIADFAVIWGVVKLTEKMMNQRDSAGSSATQ